MSNIDLLTLDPGDVQRLFEQDALMEEYGAMPTLDPAWHWRTEWASPSTLQLVVPLELKRCDLPDTELATCIRDLRNAAKLPLNEDLIVGVRFLLDVAEQEARRRIAQAARRKTSPLRYPAWEDADLVAEVEAVCGPGRRRGREVWFSCHWHEDRRPSLHVDPVKRIWKCFGCQRAGGVVAWRRAIEAAA
jgi:hypothetical protein